MLELLKELGESILESMIAFARALESTKFALVILSLPIATYMAFKLNGTFVEYVTLYLMPAIIAYTGGKIIADKQKTDFTDKK